MAGHSLTAFEASAINSILDEEERRLTGSSAINPRLSALDEQCRRIWPSWESSSAARAQTTYQPPKRLADVDLPSPNLGVKPPERFTGFASPNDFTSRFHERDYEYKSPPRTEPPLDTTQYNVESLKGEVDSLMARIKATTRSPTSTYSPDQFNRSPVSVPDPQVRRTEFRSPVDRLDDLNVPKSSYDFSPSIERISPKFTPSTRTAAPQDPPIEAMMSTFDRARVETSPFGRNQSETVGFGRNQTDSPNFGRTQTEAPNFGRTQTDAANFGKTQTDSPNFGRTQTHSPNFGRTQTDAASFGRTAVETGSFGKTQPEISPLGRPQSETSPFELPQIERQKTPESVKPTKVDSHAESGGFAMPEALRLQQENIRRKAELLKCQKILAAEKEENQKLLMSLDKSEQLRAVYKKRLEEYQRAGKPAEDSQ